MKIINGCPYQSSNNGVCTHNGSKSNRKKKRYCRYKNQDNCEFFIEWDLIRKSIARMSKNHLDKHPDEEMI